MIEDAVGPVFQVYVSAPPLIIVTEPPEHTSVSFDTAPIVTIGFGLTMMICEALAEQPALLIPLTLYKLETDGVITKEDPIAVAAAQL